MLVKKGISYFDVAKITKVPDVNQLILINFFY